MRHPLRHYDRRGNEISFWQAVSLLSSISARRVALDYVGDTEISTVHLVTDHAFMGGPPLLFETMCFDRQREGEPGTWQMRHHTEAKAAAVHAQVVRALKRGITLDELDGVLDSGERT